jgi:hypothetical protein
MPTRVREFLLFPVAMSPAACAEALQIHRRKIDRAIRFEGLPVYQNGSERRVLVQDLVDWVRRTWKKGR